MKPTKTIYRYEDWQAFQDARGSKEPIEIDTGTS